MPLNNIDISISIFFCSHIIYYVTKNLSNPDMSYKKNVKLSI